MRKAAGVMLAITVAASAIWNGAAIAQEMKLHDHRRLVELDPRDIVGDAAISLSDAIDAALRARPGRAVEAELEAEVGDKGRAFYYEIMVVAEDGDLHEVHVDPGSGDVQSDDRETDAVEMRELARFQRALRYTEHTLGDLVANAETVAKGTPVAAELELQGASPEADVLFVSGRHLIEVGVEARAGQIIWIGLKDLPEEPVGGCSRAGRDRS